MSGIINYFHGESGTVSDCWWELARGAPVFAMALEGDPHRAIAWDCGSDIGIDPRIVPGDEVIYLRLEDTVGIWVQSECQSPADLSQAVARVLENRRWIDRWRSAATRAVYIDIAREIFEARGDPLRITRADAGDAAEQVLAEGWAILALTSQKSRDDRPRTAASFFLSHAAEDTLLARRVFEDLRNDANADVWLDLSQPLNEVPQDDSAIGEWLERSVREAKGFVILWTEHAASSAWVAREFKWAAERRRSHPEYRLLLLKLRDVPVPAEFGDACTVIDCNGIWWSNGLNEELYAAVFDRQSRRAWFPTVSRGGPVSESTTIGYDDFVSDAGVVVAFDWSFADAARPESLRWQLECRRRDGTVRRDAGGGRGRAADLSMKAGDRVGFYNVRWRHGSHFLNGPELWMRSGQVGLTSDMVLDQYFRTLEGQ